MTTISSSDHSAALALRGLNRSSEVMSKAMERLASGKRMNHSSDDVAGMGISTKLKAQVLGLNANIKNASAGLDVVNTIEGSINEVHDLLMRMRELAVKASSDFQTGIDREFIQEEINHINLEINRISNITEFNGVKVLDGTYNRNISIGKTESDFISLNLQSTDINSLGEYELLGKGNIGLRTDSHAQALEVETGKYIRENDYIVKGSFNQQTIKVVDNASARDVANAFNLFTDETGIKASAITRGQVLSVSAKGDYNFTLEGRGGEKHIVNVAIEDVTDLTSLNDAINGISGSTGITASINYDKSSVNLFQDDGYNIIIGDLIGPGGWAIRAQHKKPDGSIQDTSLPGSPEVNLTISGSGTGHTTEDDSIAIFGQVTLTSHKAFTLKPSTNYNSFSEFWGASLSDNTDTIHSSLNGLDQIDLKTQNGASNAMSIIDGAIAMISEIRSEMGATNKRFSSIVNSLTNISIGTEKAAGLAEDANFAEETSKLAVSQVLHQSATSMVAQASNVKKYILGLMNL